MPSCPCPHLAPLGVVPQPAPAPSGAAMAACPVLLDRPPLAHATLSVSPPCAPWRCPPPACSSTIRCRTAASCGRCAPTSMGAALLLVAAPASCSGTNRCRTAQPCLPLAPSLPPAPSLPLSHPVSCSPLYPGALKWLPFPHLELLSWKLFPKFPKTFRFLGRR